MNAAIRISDWNKFGVPAAGALASLLMCSYFLYPLTSFFRSSDGGILFVTGSLQRAVAERAGSKAEAFFTLRNTGKRNVTIYSAKTNCGCSYITDLPMNLRVGESKELKFIVKTRSDQANQEVKQEATLYTDSDSGPIALAIMVRVGPSSPKVDGAQDESEDHPL